MIRPLLLAVVLCQASNAQTVGLYAPGSLANQFAASSSDAPFTIYSSSSQISMRYQQVIAPSSFSSVLGQGGWITAVSFRADEGNRQAWGGKLTDVQMNLSTTLKLPDSLSPVFADNVGFDETIVFARGQFSVETGARNGPVPATSFSIRLQKPFFYDPSRGALLLDIRNFKAADLQSPGDPKPMLDAVNELGDGLSRVFATDVNALKATQVDTIGLFSCFTFTAVPEPGTSILVLSGLTGLLLSQRIRARPARTENNHSALNMERSFSPSRNEHR